MSLNKHLISHAFNRAASTYDAAAVLYREVSKRLFERLNLIRLQPKTILDLGCNTGYCAQQLAKHYRPAHVIALDIAHNMLLQAKRRAGWFTKQVFVGADAAQLPFADHSIDMIFSNLVLQWCDLTTVFAELRRVLRPGGLLLFATYGPDTLQELRASFSRVDNYTHVNHFIDMHDIGDILIHNKFADPVMDMEMITLTYPDVGKFLLELKALGANTILTGKRKTLMGKQQWQSMLQQYENFRDKDNRIPATFEIVYGHAWGPALNVDQIMNAAGEVSIPLNRIAGLRKK